MEILNFDSNGSNRSPKKRARVATIVGGAFLFAAIGSTFAANVTINTTNTLEYGQGLTQAAACNPSLKIIPTNKFVNTAGGGAFYLETVTVQDTTTATAAGIGLGNCAGKTIRVTAYGDTGNALNLSGGATAFCDINVTAYTSSSTQGTLAVGCTATLVKSQNAFALNFTNAPLLASSIYKITLESFNTPA
jgi:hypothetical protein